MKAKLILPVLIFLSILVSCNKSDKKSEIQRADLKALELQEPALQKNKEPQQVPIGNGKQLQTDSISDAMPLQAANPDWEKKMIKTGTVKLEVKNFRNYSNSVHKTIKQFGGYIAQEEQTLTDERTETMITIKVPVEQFENMINQLPGDEDKVMERKISTEDVTTDIVDTRSRLEAKKQMRVKYLEFLKQSKNMEEVLQVQNSINGIQEEMESAAGRIQSLSRQSLYSTINLTFYQPATGYTAPGGSPSFFTKLADAFKTGGSWVAAFFVGLISIWPLVLIGVGIYFGWRRVRTAKLPVSNL